MEFETNRFTIRKLELGDFDAFYDMQRNEKVMRYIKAPLSYEESKVELQKFIDYYKDSSRFFLLWAIEDKFDEAFVGICGVYHNEEGEHEIAYRLREQFWGKGIGREVAKGLISHCTTVLDVNELVAHVDEENIGSVKILEREMRFEKREYSEDRGCFTRKYVSVGC